MKIKAFTLAELMIVMLVVAIILAATAPIITKRRKMVNDTNPWRWATNKIDAYFGQGNGQTAMIGQASKTTTDSTYDSKLIINKGNAYNHILFKQGTDTVIATLHLNKDKKNIALGGPYTEGTNFINHNADVGGANTAFGWHTLANITYASNNTAFGAYALEKKQITHNSTAVGCEALRYNLHNQNTAVGSGALRGAEGASGNSNSALGFRALFSNTNGLYNVAVGDRAATLNTTGKANVAAGYLALSDNTTGSNNVAIGRYAMGSGAPQSNGSFIIYKNNTGSNNVAVGSHALVDNTTGSYNVAIGNAALGYGNFDKDGRVISFDKHNTGDQNVAVGPYALTNNTSGSYNTAMGSFALYSNTTGNYSTAIGYQACQHVTTGSNKTCIGAYSGPSSGSAATTNNDKVIYLGDPSTTVYIPGRLLVNKTMLIDNKSYDYNFKLNIPLRGDGYTTSTRSFFVHNSGLALTGNSQLTGTSHLSTLQNTYSSDRRLKNIKGEDKAGLEKIRQLKVFDFTFKKDKDKTPHVGVIAQDLQKVFPNAVTKGKDGYLMIRMEDMFYAVINAIKELDKTLQALEKKIDTLITQQKENTKRIDTLEQQVKSLSLGAPIESKLHCLGPVCVIGK